MIKSSGRFTLAKWLIVLAVVLGGLWGFYFFNNYKPVYITNHSPKKEVNDSPFFTANFLLTTQGKTGKILGSAEDSELRAIWADKDNANGKLIVIETIKPQQEKDLQAMLDWVAAGGHLLSFNKEYLATYQKDDNGDYDVEDLTEYLDSQNPLLLVLGIAREQQGYHYDYDEKWSEKERELVNKLNSDNVPALLDGVPIVLSHSANDGAFVPFEPFFDQLKTTDDDTAHKWLDRYEQYQRYREQIVPISYELLGKNSAQNAKNLANLPKYDQTNLLTIHQLNDKLLSSKQAVYDVKLGAGRITILASSRMIGNPNAVKKDNLGNQDNKSNENASQAKNSQFWQNLTRSSWDWDYDGYGYNGDLMSVDNAYFFHHLTANARQVWFVANFDRPTLGQLIWRHLPFLAVAVLVSLGLAMLALPRQFGAVQAVREDRAFNLFLLFEELAGFLWRADQLKKQVASTRTHLLDKIFAHLPTLVGVQNPNQICAIIAEHSNLDDDVVYQALYGEWANESEFLLVGQALTRLARVYAL